MIFAHGFSDPEYEPNKFGMISESGHIKTFSKLWRTISVNDSLGEFRILLECFWIPTTNFSVRFGINNPLSSDVVKSFLLALPLNPRRIDTPLPLV